MRCASDGQCLCMLNGTTVVPKPETLNRGMVNVTASNKTSKRSARSSKRWRNLLPSPWYYKQLKETYQITIG